MDQPTDEYAPLIDSDKTTKTVPASTKTLRAINKLKVRCPAIADEERKQILAGRQLGTIEEAFNEWGLDYEGDALSEPEFYEEVAVVLFPMIGEGDIANGNIDFGEVQRALMDFTMSGMLGTLGQQNGSSG